MKLQIFDLENWREIFATLSRNKTRTLLTAFGIFWGTAMLAMLLGGSKGLELTLMKNFDGFATNSAILFSGRRTKSYQGFNKGSSWNLNSKDIDAIRAIEGIADVTSTNFAGTYTVSSGKYSTSAPANGVDGSFPKVFLPIIRSGRFINDADQANERKVCVLGTNVADNLFPGKEAVGEYVQMQGVYYKVIGVAYQESEIQINGDQLQEQIVTPISTMRKAFHIGDYVGTAIITVDPGVSPTDLKPRIFRAIRANHAIAPDDENAMWFMDISEQFKMVDNLFIGITLLALFVGIGTLLAGIIGVGNIMWVIVKERTQEIGIRRAIGAKPRDIVMQILCEGVALTFIAGMAGIVFAALVLQAVQMATEISYQISFGQALLIMLIFVVLGSIAGLIPALKSMKIKPVEAINDK